MARLVLMRTDLGPLKYDVNDVVDVFETYAPVGTSVSLDEWEAAGRDPQLFPAFFYVIDVTDLSVAQARNYLEHSVTRRREWTVDLQALNSSLTPPARRTLNTRYYLEVTTAEAQRFVSRK